MLRDILLAFFSRFGKILSDSFQVAIKEPEAESPFTPMGSSTLKGPKFSWSDAAVTAKTTDEKVKV